MKTIICGSRNFTDDKLLYKVMIKLSWKPTAIISGKARGADTIGEEWAREHLIPVIDFPALWEKYGKAAGPIRNKLMNEEAEACVAFLYPNSKGTQNMIDQFRKSAKGRPLCVVYCDEGTWVEENV